ncbi:MAG: extracellular solute-binding protein [Betaproteobacteria bacterium]|nr:MAG: extracellular solute-binding protein [Betaproteobacteria bacterium]
MTCFGFDGTTALVKRTVALVLLAAGAVGAAQGQSRADEAVALYDGPDREQRLIAGAHREGVLTFYTSLHEQNLPLFLAAFERKYGIKVKTWRSGADKVLQRVVTEAGAGRSEADAVHVGSGELEAMHREQLLQQVKSPYHRNLLAAAMPAHREWAPTYLTVWVQAYNTNAVKKADLPGSWRDLADPRWKGKLAIEAGDDDWFAKMMEAMGEPKALALFRDIVAANGISVRKGHSLLGNLVVSGEVPFALGMHYNVSEFARKQGAPVGWVALEPVVARANGVAVARRAPHPYAALLFYDFLIGDEGQRLFAQRDYVPASGAVPSPMKIADLRIIDPGPALDEAQKSEKVFRDVFRYR